MCVWFLALGQTAGYPLILAGNRDEFFSRPARAAHFWESCPGALAGKDESGKGTWMGATDRGSFGLLTNFRDPAAIRTGLASRGVLVREFLCGNTLADDYVKEIGKSADNYNPFNLVVGDKSGVYWVSNRGGGPLRVPPGIHGLSNHFFNTPWPKVEKGKAALAVLCKNPLRDPAELSEDLFSILSDTGQAPDELLPDTGVGLELERVLSSVFVRSPGYGTRCSTVLLLGADGKVFFEERIYCQSGQANAPAPDNRKRFILHWPTGVGSLLYTYQENPENPEYG